MALRWVSSSTLKTMPKEGVAIVADLHTNSLAGIRPAKVYRDDATPVLLNKASRWLLHTWERNWSESLRWLDGVDTRTLIVNGDAVDIDAKGRTTRVISRNPANVVTMAVDLLEPIVKEFDRVFVIRGTESHVGGSGYLEELVADDLGAEQDKETGNSSWWHLRAMFGGVRFDIAHHITMGTLRWTEHTAPDRYAFETEVQYKVEWEEPPPDVVVRSHVHRYSDSGTSRIVRVFVTPCWQFTPPYLMRKGKYNERPHFGSLAFICDDGHYTCSERKFVYRPKREKLWTSKK